MQINPDFSEVFDGVPPGTYKVQIAKVEQKTAKSGTPMLNWQLVIYGSPNRQLDGFYIYHSTPMAGKGAGFLKQFLQAVDPAYQGGTFNTDSLMRRELMVTVAEQFNQDGSKSMYPKVVSVAPLEDAGSNASFDQSPPPHTDDDLNW